MAISKEVGTKVASIDERTGRVTLNLPLTGDRSIEGIREDASFDAEGALIKVDGLFPPVHRKVDDVADEEVEVDGTTVSFTFLTEALEAFFDRWAQEDAERAAADKEANDKRIEEAEKTTEADKAGPKSIVQPKMTAPEPQRRK